MIPTLGTTLAIIVAFVGGMITGVLAAKGRDKRVSLVSLGTAIACVILVIFG